MGISKTVSVATYTRIEIDIDLTFGRIDVGQTGWYLWFNNAPIVGTTISGVQTLVWEGNSSLGELSFPNAIAYGNPGSPPPGGSGQIHEIRYYGTGTPPDGLGTGIE